MQDYTSIFDYALNGTMPLESGEENYYISHILPRIRTKIDSYDRAVDNGKYGHLGASYGHLGGRPKKTPRKNPQENDENVENPQTEYQKLLDQQDDIEYAIEKLAYGHLTPTYQQIDNRLIKTKYTPPNLKALERLRLITAKKIHKLNPLRANKIITCSECGENHEIT